MVGPRRAPLDRCWRATRRASRARDGPPKRAEGVLLMTTTDDPRLEAILREAPTRALEPLSRRDRLRRRVHPDHAVLCIGDTWFAVGPALVVALAGATGPSFGLWPVYLAALAAQLLFDNLATTARMWLALGVPPDLQLRSMAIGF